jgi:hypothetical protein
MTTKITQLMFYRMLGYEGNATFSEVTTIEEVTYQTSITFLKKTFQIN